MNNNRLLIVEDEQHILAILDIRFKGENIELFTESDGLKVIDAARRVKPALILLDLILPNRNGLDILRELKLDQDLKNIPVVICSAQFEDSEIELAKSIGAVHYMVKPFEVDRLMAVVHHYIPA